MSEFGVYIVGNDKVLDNCLALVHSFVKNSPSTNLCLIPYDEDYEELFERLKKFRVSLFPDLDFLKELQANIDYMFSGDQAPKHKHKRNRLRNLASWFGPFDCFLYMDADIVVFRDLWTFTNSYFEKYDFFSCDRQYKNGLRWVFTSQVYNVFAKQEVTTFNAGFWGSKRGVFTKEGLFGELRDCINCYDFFDFASGALAQPVINYLVHKGIVKEKVGNILRVKTELTEPWAGIKDLVVNDYLVFANQQLLPFLHWAGREIGEGGCYSEVWNYYRNLGE